MNEYSSGANTPEWIHVGKELSRCPGCGYGDGFHVSFVAPADGRAEIVLICPRCSKRYRMGWAVTLA